MILVTGGAGKVGKHLAERLLSEGESIRILAQEKDETTEELENWGAEIFFGDLMDKKSLEIAVSGIDIVYHLAAIVDYLAPKNLMWKVNVEGTKNLMEACKQARIKRIIYLSSTAVYGKRLSGVADERTLCKPTNFYGKTKLEAEKIVVGAGGIVLRSTDTYFPGFVEGYHEIFSMLEKGKMRIIGSGKNRIQYIYIDDLVDALILAKDIGRGGKIYNIAGCETLAQEDLYGMACGYLGVELPKKHIGITKIKMLLAFANLINRIKRKRLKMIPEYIDKIAADRVFSIEKAKKQIGFNPKVGYAEGMKRMIEYYKKHRNE